VMARMSLNPSERQSISLVAIRSKSLVTVEKGAGKRNSKRQ
jgi:hypothetical protein